MDEKVTREDISIDAVLDSARREFLQKAGKLALCTPPTLLALMYPRDHAIAGGGRGGTWDGGGGKRGGTGRGWSGGSGKRSGGDGAWGGNGAKGSWGDGKRGGKGDKGSGGDGTRGGKGAKGSGGDGKRGGGDRLEASPASLNGGDD